MTVSESQAGFFGKLLSRGDFVSRGLPPALVSHWDNWLQRSFVCSQQQLGTQWLEVYLTSPIWHFTLRPECYGASGWVGLLMPSVDRVGRHYPLLIAAPLQGTSVAFGACQMAWQTWLSAAEQLARQSLLGQLSPEQLEGSLSLQVQPRFGLSHGQGTLPRPLHGSELASIHPSILDAASSFWWTSGSARIAPSFLLCNGLPQPEHFQFLLTGHWLD